MAMKTTPPEDLTDGQFRVLREFAELIRTNPAPSQQEWADAAGISYSTLKGHYRELVRRGYIETTPGKSRTTRLTDEAKAALYGRRK